VIYTSGSTGRPKGVLVPHRGMANLAAAQSAIFQAAPGDTVLQMASPAFDAAVAELVTALCLGGRLCLAGRDALLPGPGLLDLLTSRGVTHATITPSVLVELPDPAAGDLPQLRTLVVAGEACPAGLVARWSPGRRLVNAYGPTEVTIWATGEICLPEGGAPAIGRPIPHVGVHVVDEALHPVPLGVPGELCIGGVGVARGYLGLPERTAERFVPDPYASTAGSRLYRTGDLGRYRADGRIDFLGRIDQQVKVRGVRIEPGEVESALRSHPAVRDAAVVAQEDGRGGRRLAAWVVASGTAPLPGTAELRRFLAAALPEPMIPAAISILDALPLTPNGKLDRLALARQVPEQLRAGERMAPRDELELALFALWEEVLGDRSLGVTDDFFQAGGHSLLAVRLMARIRERLGRELPLAALFAGASVERLAALLRQSGPPPRREPLVELRTVESSRAPLFLIHPVGGNVLCYAELARALDRTVYGLQMPDPDQEGFPASLEELATLYLEEVRKVRPEPPHHLAGWSMGGVLAFEMARQLGRRNGRSGLLAIADAEPPLEARAPVRDEDLLRRFALDLAGLSASGAPLRLPELAPGSGDALEEELFAFARQAGLIPPGLGLSTVRTLFHMFRVNVGFLRAYGGGEPCAGPALLLLAKETAYPGRCDELAHGWSALIGSGLEVRSLPGNHYSLLKRPNVQSLAEQLRKALTRAEP